MILSSFLYCIFIGGFRYVVYQSVLLNIYLLNSTGMPTVWTLTDSTKVQMDSSVKNSLTFKKVQIHQ